MTRGNVTLIVVLVVGLFVGGIIGWAAFPREVATEVTAEVPMTLPAIAQGIRSGDIDVGTEYGLGPDQRYHKIHATVLGLACSACHATAMSEQEEIFSAQDMSDQAPLPVNRALCLGCHGVGLGASLYGPGGS